MAEIKIEKKPPVWPWILLGLLLLGFLVYWFALRDQDTDDRMGMEEVENTEMVTTNETGPVAEYIALLDNDTEPMGLDHEFTNEALMKLTAAAQAVADQSDYDITADLDQVREYANKIEVDPFETTHANSIRKASEILAGSLHKMQEAKFPQLANEAQSVVSAADKIDPDVLTLDQKPAVKGFFNEAASLLRRMN
ncbi:hypothetical protein [Persicitalea jodogahamensis]|uniref:Uncharacterized protein n=1 Tax=Persicitalea jodogahamensis TaxID=402147 RepID=A0A8J3D2K9_9BACT|nr:hypothetical protein [Persicitalea jodogahamensis]GHB70627.1 hypothetical protein GCM10007390_25440 [Persicitalea jodogahamensis]